MEKDELGPQMSQSHRCDCCGIPLSELTEDVRYEIRKEPIVGTTAPPKEISVVILPTQTERLVNETRANGVTGFLLYDPFEKRHFFRVYKGDDKSQFTDYKICADDVEVILVDNFVALYDGKENKLDYASEVMGRAKPTTVPPAPRTA